MYVQKSELNFATDALILYVDNFLNHVWDPKKFPRERIIEKMVSDQKVEK